MSRANPRFRRTNPTLPAVGGNNVYSVQLGGTADNEIWLVNLAVMGPDTPVSTTESGMASSIESQLSSALPGVLDTATKWTTVKVASLTIPTRIPYIRYVNSGNGYAGTASSTHIPKEMSAIISKYTGYKGQHGRGRNYWPAVPSSFVTASANANQLNATGVSAYTTLFGIYSPVGWINANGTSMTTCVYQRALKGAPVINAAPVLSYVVRTVLGTTRRRRPGRGK